ncbi:MAG: helix-turn-helix domain-containing protein [Oscillospiraceae bacterium]
MEKIDVKTISLAIDGNPKAILKILQYYDDYIDRCAIMSNSLLGGEDRKEEIKAILIDAIKNKFKQKAGEQNET